MEIYSSPVFESNALNPAESEAASSGSWLELSGAYTLKETQGGVQKWTANLSATATAEESETAMNLTPNLPV